MKRKLRIGVLTGGGDVPGLNPCIRALTYRALDDGHEVLGIRRGWQGLVDIEVGNPESEQENSLLLSREQVRTVDRFGGTFLHTSRTNPTAIERDRLPNRLRAKYVLDAVAAGSGPKLDITMDVYETVQGLELDYLVTIGGDDTLSVAVRLDAEGCPIVAVPKTMDNDVHGTDYCLGFSTAVTRSVNFINDLRTPAGSHERIAVVELFGRNCGETAFLTGYLASTDRTIIAEVPFDIQKLAELAAADKKRNPSKYSIIVMSEGARMIDGEIVEDGEADPFGHRKLGGIADSTGLWIKRLTGESVLIQRLAYLMRSGPPDSLDRLVAYNYGNLAYEQILNRKSGEMVALQDGCYTTVPISRTMEGLHRVDVEKMYDVDAYRPRILSVRGTPMFL